MDTLLTLSIAGVAVLALAWWLISRRARERRIADGGDRLDTLAGWPPTTTQILRTSERIAYSTLRRLLHTALGLPLPPRILHLDTEAAATR